jgi:glutathione S-transferase
MKLYISPASPFARKCRIVARERKLIGRVEEVVVDPYADDQRLLQANPIAQVPALELDDGNMFAGSPVICAYLDSFSGRPQLLPPSPQPAHWRVRRMETLADGVLELAVKLTLEKRRPEGERSPFWIERWRSGLHRALDAAEAQVRPPEPLDLGLIALGCIGAYLDLRHPDFGWRNGRPRLTAFSAEIEKRDSFRATAPA